MKKLDQCIFICLLLLVLGIPVSIAAVGIFASSAAFLFLVKRVLEIKFKVSSRTPIPESVIVPALAFFSACALSVCVSEAPKLGIVALVGKVLQGILLLFAVVDVVNSRQRLLWVFAAIGLAAFIVSADGLWQVVNGVDIIRNAALDGGRIKACMKHPNDLGVYLILPVIVSWGLLLWAWFETDKVDAWMRSKAGMLAVFLLGVSLAALGLTYSRGSWLGALVAVVVFTLMRRKYGWVCFGLVIVFAFFFAPRMTLARDVSFISDGVSQSSGHFTLANLNNFSGSDRLNMWKDAARIIKDHPVFGTGLNTYTRVIYRYSEFRKLYPHNGYLQMMAEVGAVGLGSFIWLLMSVGLFAAKGLHRSQKGIVAVLVSGLFAAWIGFLFQSGLDTTFYSVQLSRLLWFMLGLLVAGGMVLENRHQSTS